MDDCDTAVKASLLTIENTQHARVISQRRPPKVARVTRAFSDAGIMVHAYLMYAFPTETAQDTIDALERVRQLFAAGCIQSAYWHRFAATRSVMPYSSGCRPIGECARCRPRCRRA
jgi:hypothetical protein